VNADPQSDAVLTGGDQVLIDGLPGSNQTARNFGLMAVGDVYARLVSFMVLTVLARSLGAGALGQFSIGQLSPLFAPAVIDFGVSIVLVRSLAIGRHEETNAISQAWGFRLVIAGLWSLGSIALAAMIARSQPDVALILVAFVPFAFSLALDPALIFQARQNLKPLVIVRVIGFTAYAALGVLIVLTLRSLPLLALVFSSAHLAGTIVAVLLLQQGGLRLIRPTLWHARDHIRAGTGLALAALSAIAATGIGTFWIALLADSREVGLYNACLRVILVVLAPAAFVLHALLPRVAASWQSNRPEFAELAYRAARILGFAAWVAAALMIVSARGLLGDLFGPSYALAYGVLTVLALLLPAAYLVAVLQAVYMAAHQDRWYVSAMIASAAFCLMTTAPLFAAFGITGVAAAVVLSEACLAGLLLVHVPSLGAGKIVTQTVFPAVPIAALAGLITVFAQAVVPWKFAAAGGFTVAAVIGIASGLLSVSGLWRLLSR
jgi:O-antigen/teichoic acid export membrane protein